MGVSTLRDTEYYAEVARGNIPGVSTVHKFGAANVGTTIVHISQSLVYQTPTTAVNLEFVSSSANDALNNVGAREITFIGLDANWAEQTVTMATHATVGTTAVAITGTWRRLYRWHVSQSGAYASSTVGSHVGTLTVRVAGAGATWSTIGLVPFATGQSQIGAYTVPLGKTAYLLSKGINVEGTKPADVLFFQRPLANDVTTPYTGTMRLVEREVGVTGHIDISYLIPKGPFVGPCDLGFMGKVTSGDSEVSVEFELLIENS